MRRHLEEPPELLFPADQRRPHDRKLGGVRSPQTGVPAPAATDALDQCEGLLARLGSHLAHAGVKPIEKIQRPGTVPRECPRAKGGAQCRFGGGVDQNGPLGRLAGLLCPAEPGQIPGRPHEHLDRSPPPELALRGQPVLELRRIRNREAFEKLPGDELRGAFPVLGGRELLQPIHVQLDQVRGQPDLACRRIHGGLAGVPANHPERLAERVPGRGLGPISPQQPDEVLAAPGPTGRPCEINQQGQVLAPEQLRWGRTAVHADLDRSQRAAKDQLNLGGFSGRQIRIIRTARKGRWMDH